MAQAREIPWPGWAVVRTIGSGSFGQVYEIERDVFGHIEKAALKVISIPRDSGEIEEMYSDGYDDNSITQRLSSQLKEIVREYNIMSDMKGHANIVHSEDVQCVRHREGFGWDIYIRMELLMPLHKAIGEGFSEERTVQLGLDICNALIACRSKGVVHRDIKPQNILVSEDGNFKLGDFGIAKSTDHTASGTKTGTYKYMAPEVYNSQPYGHGADIYSLGMVLYWLLNERRTPFLPLPPQVPNVRDEESARLERFKGTPIPPPLHGSAGLKRIVLKACAFHPEQRYRTAEQMRSDLLALNTGGRAAPAQRSDPAGTRYPAFGGSGAAGSHSRGSTVRAAADFDGGSARFSPQPERETYAPKRSRSGLLGWALLGCGMAAFFVTTLVVFWLLTAKPSANEARCQGIYVEETQLSFSSLEERIFLRPQLTPADTTDSLMFLSGNPAIARVDGSGIVTPVGEGQTEITITCGEERVVVPVRIQLPTAPPETKPTPTVQTLPQPTATVPATKPREVPPPTTSPTPQPAAVQTNKGYISNTENGLNVRQSPSTSAQIVSRLFNGDRVTILERRTADGMEWGRISGGWICINYVTFENEDGTQASGTAYMVKESTDAVNIRSGAGTSYQVIKRAFGGEKLVIYEQKYAEGLNWGRTELGWACMDYLEPYRPKASSKADTAGEESIAVLHQQTTLHASPSSASRVVTTLDAGESVRILRTEPLGSIVWCYVSCDGRNVMGWLDADVLDM